MAKLKGKTMTTRNAKRVMKKLIGKAFPFQFEFVSPTGEQAVHMLKRKEGEYNSATVADRLKQLQNPKNTKWHNTVAKWKEDIANGHKSKPSRKLRVKFAYVKVKDIVIDDDIQRDMDPDWVASIGNPAEFEEEFMSTIYCMYDTKTKKYISINAQHTLVLETAFAANDLWDDLENYEGDPMELEVPVTYFPSSSRAKCRKGFQIFNGRQKPIEPYVNHKMLVLAYRVDKDRKDKEAKKAHAIQTINEEEGFEPVSKDDKKNKKFSWAITCVAEMMNHYDRPDRWQFVLRTHKRYWPNIQLDTAEVDLYGFIYDYFTELKKYDVYSDEFNEQFLDPCMALIWKFFTTPSGFKNDSSSVQKRFGSAKTGLPEDKVKIDDNGSCVYLLKLYRHFGGKHELPMYVNNLSEERIGDLLNYVDNERTLLVEEMSKYGQS
jgi:hypothetical protein